MPTFHLLNFGCRASQADGAALKKQLLDAGLSEANDVGGSSVAVLNTCTVTASADAEVRQVVRRIHRANPHCQILVTGCYAQRAPEEIAQLPGVKWVVGNSHKHNVANLLRSAVGHGSTKADRADVVDPISPANSRENHRLVQIGELHHGTLASSGGELHSDATEPSAQVSVGVISEEFHFAPVFADDRTRPTLKIQDGCGARCSFCIIPTVRGPSRSLHPDTVLAQVRTLVDAGYKELVLSGINLGSYGRDLGRSTGFLELLERILAETAVARIRISSIEPMDVSKRLVDLVATNPRMAQHFHVPLQSGCDRILRKMNRRYWAQQYAERIQSIREKIPCCGIGADVMVGFPGETDKDHATSVRFLESLPLTYVHVFPYSARPSTPAATMQGQVNGRIAHERSREIRSLVGANRRAFLAAQVGGTLSVVTLEESAQGERVALSSNYIKAVLPGLSIPPNSMLDVRVGRSDSNLVYGYPATGPASNLRDAFVPAGTL